MRSNHFSNLHPAASARRFIVIAALLLSMVAGRGAVADERNPEADLVLSESGQVALDAVARRIAGYNAHDIEAFLAAHAEQVGIYEFPEQQIGVGHAHLRWIFTPQFERGLGHVEVLGQFVIGNRVISHEYITIGDEIERLVTVYTVTDGLISSFRLIEAEN